MSDRLAPIWVVMATASERYERESDDVVTLLQAETHVVFAFATRNAADAYVEQLLDVQSTWQGCEPTWRLDAPDDRKAEARVRRQHKAWSRRALKALQALDLGVTDVQTSWSVEPVLFGPGAA